MYPQKTVSLFFRNQIHGTGKFPHKKSIPPKPIRANQLSSTQIDMLCFYATQMENVWIRRGCFHQTKKFIIAGCPKIENARATLHNDINDSPQLLLIHTGTNDLSITPPIVEFIAELSTLITEAATKFPTSKIIYSTLLPRTDIPIPIITRINEQLITECSRLPNVHLINHANLFAEGIDLLHDTKHIKRRHIGLFAANLIDAIRGRARQTRYSPKVVNHVNRSPRRQVPKNKYSSYSQALQSTPAGDYQIPNSQPRQQSKRPALSGSHHYQTQLLDQPRPPPPRQCSNTPQT